MDGRIAASLNTPYHRVGHNDDTVIAVPFVPVERCHIKVSPRNISPLSSPPLPGVFTARLYANAVYADVVSCVHPCHLLLKTLRKNVIAASCVNTTKSEMFVNNNTKVASRLGSVN